MRLINGQRGLQQTPELEVVQQRQQQEPQPTKIKKKDKAKLRRAMTLSKQDQMYQMTKSIASSCVTKSL